MNQRRWILLAAAVLVLGCMALAGYHGAKTWLLGLRAAEVGTWRAVDVPTGGVADVARALAEAGIIKDARLFRLAARLTEDQGSIKAGEYELSPTMNNRRILTKLRLGQVLLHRILLPEGWTSRQMVERLAEHKIVSLDPTLELLDDNGFITRLNLKVRHLEGYLFPDTYLLSKNLGGRAVLSTMVRHFHKAWDKLSPAAAEVGLGQRQAVILASIIEKEAAVDGERALISAVYHNRLKLGMRLQADPTVIYGLKDFDGNLTRDDLAKDTPYNTYLHKGLPPGPICNPGWASLEAAVKPAKANYLYFVSKGDGRHVFSRTYREQVNAVNRYQRRR